MTRFLALTLSLAIPALAAATPPVTGETQIVHSATDCRKCHEKADAEYRANGVYDIIVPDAAAIWAERDPHSKAAQVLDKSNPLAARMSAALGYDVARQPECLACHAVDVTLNAPLAEKKFAWKHGVGCEGCHGFAAKWFGDHTLKTWREVEPVKKSELGLVDLRDPITRAAKCATCHVGNLAEGKFVTHAMYAAGHPPLLPLEAATFNRDQPAHWNPPEDVPYIRSLPPEKAAKFFHAPPGQLTAPRSVATGAVVTLRESAKLLAADAERVAKDGGLLDFAHFDCFACHHELQVPSHRQKRGYPGVPGRPTVRQLPTDLVGSVLAHARTTGTPDRQPELKARLSALNSAFDQRAFGEPAAIASAAQQLVTACDNWLGDVRLVRYDTAGRDALLAAIRATGNPAGWDYDAAQLQAWAARALIEKSVAPGVWNSVLPTAGIDPKSGSVDTALKSRLRVRNSFDPARFAEAWRGPAPK
ncbi:MAG: cytochrome c family protein [Gemmataceae bacterium]|nr:cytochrome c family protein [Gemmataceae bacterium]